MLRSLYVVLIACAAAPVIASPDRGDAPRASSNTLDWLYPEIAVDDASWRELLPVVLLDTDALAEQPAPRGERSERAQPR